MNKEKEGSLAVDDEALDKKIEDAHNFCHPLLVVGGEHRVSLMVTHAVMAAHHTIVILLFFVVGNEYRVSVMVNPYRGSLTVSPYGERRVIPAIIIVPIVDVERKTTSIVQKRGSITVSPT